VPRVATGSEVRVRVRVRYAPHVAVLPPVALTFISMLGPRVADIRGVELRHPPRAAFMYQEPPRVVSMFYTTRGCGFAMQLLPLSHLPRVVT
jgi:hypothetical protein